ncbi:MAG: hypothetical protein Rhob2KO_10620 [Rhodopirellula baltica]
MPGKAYEAGGSDPLDCDATEPYGLPTGDVGVLGTPGVLSTVGMPAVLDAYMLGDVPPGIPFGVVAGAVPPAIDAIAFGVALEDGGCG